MENSQYRSEAELFRQFMENMDYVFWIRDLEIGKIVYISPAFEKVWGLPREEIYRDPGAFLRRVHPDDHHIVLERRGRLDSEKKQFDMEYRLIGEDGSFRWIRARTFPIRDRNGEVRRVAGLAQDATEEIQYREELRRARDNLRQASMVFQSSGEAILITDLNSKIVEVNPAFERITGYSKEEILGKTPAIMKSGKHTLDFYREMWKTLLQEGHWQGEVWDRRKSGEAFPKWLTISVVRDDSGNPVHYVGIFTDISRIKQTEANLQKLAHFDPLTDLPNRILFRDRLGQALAEKEGHRNHVAVLFLDLDGFKEVNDSLGHTAGDLVLIEMAKRLQTVIRHSDTISRLGGDEFTIVLNSIEKKEDAALVAEKILEVIQNPFHIDCNEVTVSASIGIALSPEDGETVEELIRCSDLCMYRAKESGKNCYRMSHTR